jgi:hypothetical protein
VEERTAEHFYGSAYAKDIVVRNVLEILIVERAEGLLRNGKSGIGRMMKEGDLANLTKIFALLKKANMVRVFHKEFQSYVQAEGELILNRISSEDERNMKSSTLAI